MKTRIIQTRFWDDEFVSELDVESKLVFIYLLTNEAIGLTGIYERPKKFIAFYCGLSVQQVEKALTDISSKILYIDGWVVIKNAIKYNNYASNSKQRTAYMNEWNRLPEHIQKYAPYFDNVDDYKPGYVKGNKTNYKHREVAEKILERKLKENEVVHHIDKNPSNNNIENLAVMSESTHVLLHQEKTDLSDTSIIVLSDYYDSSPNIKTKNQKPKTKKENFSYESFVDIFNEIKNSRYGYADKKAKGQFDILIRAGVTEDLFRHAIINARSDKYLIENPKYLTPEYITRVSQFEKWVNAKPFKKESEKKTTFDVL